MFGSAALEVKRKRGRTARESEEREAAGDGRITPCVAEGERCVIKT